MNRLKNTLSTYFGGDRKWWEEEKKRQEQSNSNYSARNDRLGYDEKTKSYYIKEQESPYKEMERMYGKPRDAAENDIRNAAKTKEDNQSETGPAFGKAQKPEDEYKASQDNLKQTISKISSGPGKTVENGSYSTTSDTNTDAFKKERQNFSKKYFGKAAILQIQFDSLPDEDAKRVMQSNNPSQMTRKLFDAKNMYK